MMEKERRRRKFLKIWFAFVEIRPNLLLRLDDIVKIGAIFY